MVQRAFPNKGQKRPLIQNRSKLNQNVTDGLKTQQKKVDLLHPPLPKLSSAQMSKFLHAITLEEEGKKF